MNKLDSKNMFVSSVCSLVQKSQLCYLTNAIGYIYHCFYTCFQTSWTWKQMMALVSMHSIGLLLYCEVHKRTTTCRGSTCDSVYTKLVNYHMIEHANSYLHLRSLKLEDICMQRMCCSHISKVLFVIIAETGGFFLRVFIVVLTFKNFGVLP